MDAHAEAVARARAIAARLAGTTATADLGGGTTAAAPQPPSATPVANGGVSSSTLNADVQAMLDAALGGGGAVNNIPTAAVASATTTSASTKRGVEDALASLIPGLGHSDSNKRARTDGGGGVGTTDGRAIKKIWIPSDRNPGYNYVGLLIGPGGSKQRELVAQSGGQVKISIRGKGSSQKMDSVPGMPDEPLHVLLEGSQECIDKAEVLVRELLENSEAADKEKARQLGSLNEGGDKPASSTYTPKPVAQILGQMAGSTPLSAYGAATEQQVEEKIGVPNGVVGYIIGKGGESITSMQRRTGCRVQIQKEHEMAPGTAQRVITLTAPTAESIAQCRGIIEEMVKERLAATASTSTTSAVIGVGVALSAGPGSNATTQMAQLQKALAEGQQHVTVQVPDADVGLIIGKGGAQIRTIQENSGANVQIPQVADANNPTVRTVNITHPNKEGAEFAKQMIQEILNAKLQQQQQQQQHGVGLGGGGGGDATIQVNCPDKDVGMIIGRGGCVIKQMQSQTRCRIQIPPTAPPGSMYRIISVSGPAAGCEQVKQMIETIVAEQSSQSVMSGVAFGNGGNHQYGHQQPYGQQNYYGLQQSYGQQGGYQQQQPYGQQQAAAGQKDYSAEWAAYYAAQAAQQGGQAAGAASVTAAATSDPAQPAHDAYYEVFWQYAAYYGEEAARKHYGAWSPPVGTPNPNAAAGVGTTQATAPAAAASASAVAQQTAQDSSVRKVSNLPAWMTKNQS
ncbi:hypothetical protein ACHAXM_004639 [Skeletonema potamos]